MSIPAQISPVNAPKLFSLMFCAPSRMLESRIAFDTDSSAVNGGANYNIHFLQVRQFALQVADQRQRLGDGFVHLPISGNNQFSFFIHN